MKNRTIVLAAALLFAISPLLAGNTVTSETQSNQVVAPSDCGVTYDQIYSYLLGYGYVATSFENVPGSCDVYVKTSVGKLIIVHISDSIINGHEQNDL